MTIRKKAHAKINLYLKIGNRRPDGYHEIATIMQKISLADDVEVSVKPKEKTITVNCSEPSLANDKNTAHLAAALFLERAKISAGVEIDIAKKIPVRAGLGGGSSDAGAALLAINEYFGYVLCDGELADVAAKVGADVPFFAKNASCALCGGIGEIVAPIKRWAELSGRFCLVAKPACGISTKQAYEDWDRNGAKNAAQMPKSPPETLSGIYNDFAEPAFSQNGSIKKIHREILGFGAAAASLCGSGSAVFGIFGGKAAAKKCGDALGQDPDVEFCGIYDFV
ncbi:MAG: 4-(cytidine 5'-diphospho)-2-C-methyl-D-erythritol kinase [Oscillospiraceae bacterium]|nr:4-(cytidine 5'-diphospho)-2-C-methyl-D-erythritol kinase [Oscillospiraceae bacterium]